MQGLCPSLQTEFPGGGVVLSALSFPPFPKTQELGLKMGEETAFGGFTACIGTIDFLCGIVAYFCVKKVLTLYF